MKLKSMRDLFIHELRDLYSAETQIMRALPKLAKAASNAELQHAFREHLEQTRHHVERLEEILTRLDLPKRGKKCKAVEGLIEDAKEIIENGADAAVLDAALIAAAQRVEHYEIAGYGCARTFAQQLREQEVASLLQETLNEEGETDKRLTRIAESSINPAAAHAEAGDLAMAGGGA